MPCISWRVELLGGLSVSCGTERITHFRTRKAASLLAYLIIYPRRHTRDELIDTFWPEADFDDARASFRVALSHIRKELGSDFLEATRDTVGIAASFTCDAIEFEQAVKAKRWNDAKSLYKGSLLPGFWDDWILSRREHLEAIAEMVTAHATSIDTESFIHLPPEPNRFFGREDEIEQMADLLTPNRLVTLLGLGGIGKTRLALATARRHAALFPGGLWFVPLIDTMEADRILPSVRDALGLPRDPNADPLDQIANRLVGELPCLLILDNFEQIAALGAPIVSTMLTRVPNLTCLISSRRRLSVSGERQKTVNALSEVASVALFCDRAQVNSSAEITELCRDLEGVPLAIELCAARAGEFTIAEMRVKLAERFVLLSSTGQDRVLRHRSLFAALAWSYQLLTAEQRRFLMRLSVFRGGWTREAAESVCEEPGAAEYLAQLRERSLVSSEQVNGTIRFRMLESVREFASEHLGESEQDELQHRHGTFYRNFAEACGVALASGGDVRWLDAMEAEHNNFRAALDAMDADRRMEFCPLLMAFWAVRGHMIEGKRRLIEALAGSPGPSLSRMNGLIEGAELLYRTGDLAGAIASSTEGVALARQLGTAEDIGRALEKEARFRRMRGENDTAERLVREALAIGIAESRHRQVAICHSTLGSIRADEMRLEEARYHYEQELEYARLANVTHIEGTSLLSLGNICRQLKDWSESRRHLLNALEIFRQWADEGMIAHTYLFLGIMAVEMGNLSEAREWLFQSAEIRQKIINPRSLFHVCWRSAQLCHIEKRYEVAGHLLTAAIALNLHWKLSAKINEDVRLAVQEALIRLSGETIWEDLRKQSESLAYPEIVAVVLNALRE